MELEKIQNTAPKIPELVMQSLLAAMEKGEIRVQEELPPERDLSASLGVSRSSLRECLAILEYMSVLETRGNRKIIIKDSAYFRKAVAFIKLSTQNMTLLDLLEFRRTMEVAGVRLACRRATEADMDALNEILLRLKKDGKDYAADAEFHSRVARASHNSYFAANMDLLGCVIEDLRLRFFELPNYYERTYNSHLKIFEAIRDGDEEAAVAETEHHMDLVLDFIREAELLDEEELSGKDG